MYSLFLHGRKLRQSHVSLHNAFAFSKSAIDLNLVKDKTFSVSYLVESLGLTTKLAESIWRKVSSDSEGKGNPESVLSLLRSHGFTNSHISTIITDYPRLLLADSENFLGPKLQFLKSRGASSSELTEILSKVPKILAMKGDITMSRYYDFVKEIVESDKSSGLSRYTLPQGSMQENKMRNVLVLRDLGVPQRFLFPLLISNLATLCGKVKFEESLKKVVEMGFDPATSKFIKALNVVYQTSDKAMEERVSVYVSLGFDVWAMFKKFPVFLTFSEKKILNLLETFIDLGFTKDEFVTVVGSCPQCIGYSAEAVKKKTEFLVKKMDWPLKALVSSPAVFNYSLEKRIVPRSNVIKALMSKGLLGNDLPSLSSILACSDETFLERFVTKHDDKQLVLEVTAIFNGARDS